MNPEERQALYDLAGIVVDIAEALRVIDRKLNSLLTGHNALVRLIRFEGDTMSAVSDAILAEDAKTVALVQSVKDLINKLNNGNNTLDAETQAALATLDGHIGDVSQEVADAENPPAGGATQPAAGPDAGTVGL
jgi:hypothetical protein